MLRPTPAIRNWPADPGVGAALATVLLWASAFPLIRIAVAEMAPAHVAAVRYAIAAVAFVAWISLTGPRRVARHDLARFAFCGLIGVALYNVLLNSGQTAVPAGPASLIVATVPILTAALAAIFLGDRLGKLAMAGIALSFSGVLVIASSPFAGFGWSTEVLAISGAALCQAIYFILVKPLIARYGAMTATAYAIAAGALWLLPWLPDGAFAAGAASLRVIGALIFLGLFPAALGYVTWSYALRDLGPARAAPFLYLVPPVATVLALVLGNEVPSLRTLMGGTLVLLGVALTNRERKRLAEALPPRTPTLENKPLR